MQPDSSQNTGSHSSSHEDIWGMLPEYVAELLHSHAASTLYPEVALHIEQCSACQERVQELQPLAQALYTGQVTAVPVSRAFDLGFLTAQKEEAARSPSLWFWETVEQAVLQFSGSVLDSLRINAAQNQNVLLQATGARSKQKILSYFYETSLEQPESGKLVQLTIKVFEEHTTPNTAQIDIFVDRSSHDPLTQEGAAVFLHAGNFEREATTTESGFALFDDVPIALLPLLRIEVHLRSA